MTALLQRSLPSRTLGWCVALLLLGGSVVAAPIPRLDEREDAARYFELPDRRLVLSAGWARAPLYWDRVRRAAVEHGVPEGVFFALALVESGFYPHARSDSGAEGMWQFMPATGNDYGLRNRSDRTDVEKSSRAAATYLAKLRQRFGGWELALAAYNAGPGSVDRAVRQAGSWRWERVRDHLRPETHAYVPKILYLAEDRYPAFVAGERPVEPVVVIEARSGDTWYGFSRRFGTPLEVLRMMNRGPLHPGAPVAIPAREHRLAPQETLFDLSVRYGISLERLLLANGALETMLPGDRLVIPTPDPLPSNRPAVPATP